MTQARRVSCCIALFAFCCAVSRHASATSIVESGTLSSDNAVVEFNFTNTSYTLNTFYTTSYGGGMNANGTMTAAGGFDPVLSLFSPSGTFLAEGGASDLGGPMVNADPVTGLSNDADFSELLGPGTYTLALSEFPNFPGANLSDAFSNSTNPGIIAAACGSSSPFLESDVSPCVQRNGSYTVNITSTAAVTPEPASWMLVLPAAFGVFFLSRRRLA